MHDGNTLTLANVGSLSSQGQCIDYSIIRYCQQAFQFGRVPSNVLTLDPAEALYLAARAHILHTLGVVEPVRLLQRVTNADRIVGIAVNHLESANANHYCAFIALKSTRTCYTFDSVSPGSCSEVITPHVHAI